MYFKYIYLTTNKLKVFKNIFDAKNLFCIKQIRLILDELIVEVDYFDTRIARHVSLVLLMNSALDHGSPRYLHKTTTQLGRRSMILDLNDG